MKITAEFNSNEELISFIGAFGAKSSIPNQGFANTTNLVTPIVETKKIDKSDSDKTQDKSVKDTKADTPTEEIKEKVAPKEAEITKEDPKDEAKITKEMVRERLGVIMKSGKQKEVKDLVAKHGASSLPNLKEEEYAAVYVEAEALL